MAKGRKLSTSRTERFLGSYGQNHDQATVNGNSELGEDEVWSIIDGNSGAWDSRAAGDSYTRRRAPPRNDRRQAGGLSLAFHDSPSPRVVHQFRAQEVESPRGRHVATSAPVSVPDWSKIYRVDSVESDYGFDYESEVVPPHEYLAREYGKSAANSVFEGVGRTLKGRDLSRVRDAVWSQTGFYG